VLGRSFLERRCEVLCVLVIGDFAKFLPPMAFQSKSMSQESYQVSEAARIRGSKILESCAMVSEASRMQTKMLRDN
jgi:hypothetical protein